MMIGSVRTHRQRQAMAIGCPVLVPTASVADERAQQPFVDQAMRAVFFRVPTVTCGQLRPLKFNSSVWVYCSCRKSGPPLALHRLDPENRVTSTDWALGPAAGAPCKNAVLARPPPTTGVAGSDEICSTTVPLIFCPAIAAMSTEFGLSTIACVIPVISAGGERKLDGFDRSDSENGIFFAVPMTNGVMSTLWICGGPATSVARPCAKRSSRAVWTPCARLWALPPDSPSAAPTPRFRARCAIPLCFSRPLTPSHAHYLRKDAPASERDFLDQGLFVWNAAGRGIGWRSARPADWLRHAGKPRRVTPCSEC
jgi:hypothetical protein